MKSTKQLLNERNMVFFKYLEKKTEAIYTLTNREEKQRKSTLWTKYLWARYEEINNKIAFNDNLQATVNERN